MIKPEKDIRLNPKRGPGKPKNVSAHYVWFSEDGQHRLTFLQKKFCDIFMANGFQKPEEAYIEAGFKPGKPSYALRTAKNLLQKPAVRAYIELMKPRYEGKLLLTRDYVIENLQRLVSDSKNDNARVSALKHLGQYLGMWVERTEVTGANGEPVAFKDAGSDLRDVDDDALRQIKALLSAQKNASEDEDRALN